MFRYGKLSGICEHSLRKTPWIPLFSWRRESPNVSLPMDRWPAMECKDKLIPPSRHAMKGDDASLLTIYKTYCAASLMNFFNK